MLQASAGIWLRGLELDPGTGHPTSPSLQARTKRLIAIGAPHASLKVGIVDQQRPYYR